MIGSLTLLVFLAGGSFALGTTLVSASSGASRIVRLAAPTIAWLGVGISCCAALGAALFVPLGQFAQAIIVALFVAALLLLGSKGRARLYQNLPFLFVAAVVGCAFATRPILFFDSALYHISAASWYGGAGIVPGLGLFYPWLGYVSAWYVPSAIAGHGLLAERAYSLPGALALTLLVWQWGISLKRISRGRRNLADLTLATAVPLVFAFTLQSRLWTSGSPDTAVIAVSVQIIYEWLRFASRRAVGRLELAWLCTLAAFGATVKLTFGPICVVALALWLWCARPFFDTVRKSLIPGVLATASVVVFCAAQALTTGYPLYPSGFAALEVPWSMRQSEVRAIQNVLAEVQRTGKPVSLRVEEEESVQKAAQFSWFLPWLMRERASAALLVASVVGTLVICFALGRRCAWVAVLVGLSLIIFFFSPSIRYVLGVFAMASALPLALGLSRMRLRSHPRLNECGSCLTAVVAMNGLAVFGFFGYTATDRVFAAAMELHQRVAAPFWLLPMEFVTLVSRGEMTGPSTQLEVAKYENKKGSNFVYQVPSDAETKVGNSGLLTTWDLLAPDLRLRDPDRGVRGGFER